MQPLKIFNSFNLASTFVSESNRCTEEDFVQEIYIKHLQQHHIIIIVIVVVVINITNNIIIKIIINIIIAISTVSTNGAHTAQSNHHHQRDCSALQSSTIKTI